VAEAAPSGSAWRRSLSELPTWFWIAIALGLALRLYLVIFTGGTLDVDVWDSHAATLNLRSMVSYYQGGTFRFNHPPPSGWFFANAWALGREFGIPFAVLLRLPFVLLDAGCVGLILRGLRGQSQRHLLAALYWLHPLAIIYSSYHGNTDSAVAFFVLLSLLFATRDRAIAAGVVLGLSLWIKLPGILAAAGLVFVLSSWKKRLLFCAALGASALIGYLPILIENASSVLNAVIFYSGEVIQTETGVTAWGLQNLLPAPIRIPSGAPRLAYLDSLDFLFGHNTIIVVIPIVVLAWCRRRETSIRGLATTIAGSYAILYGLTNYWAFQYFAWSVPFWVLGNRRFGAAATLFSTAYIYGLYAWLCGDPFLYGEWDFLGRPDWPPWLRGLRDVTNLFFLGAGIEAVGLAVWGEITFQRGAGRAISEEKMGAETE